VDYSTEVIENFIFRVDYPTEVYIRLQKCLNFIHIMYMSCINSRNLVWINYFSIADGLHTPFERVNILDKVFYSDEAQIHLAKTAKYGVPKNHVSSMKDRYTP
jgi:hypothetical protein